MLPRPNFATLNIFLFERFLEHFMFLPFIILEIAFNSTYQILHTNVGNIELLIAADREMIFFIIARGH